MNNQPRSGPRRAIAFTLIIIGGIGFFSYFKLLGGAGADSMAPVIIPLAMLIIGILLLPGKPGKLGDFWKTGDPRQAKKVLRKLENVQDNADLMTVGKGAPLEEVARAAYRRVTSQKDLASHIRTMTDKPRRLLALECLTDQGELMGLARSLDEPACVEATKRINDAGLLTALAEDESAPDAARCAAYEKLNRPRMADVVRLASPGTPPSERDRAAERILQSGDAALITRAAKQVLTSRETPEARSFVTRTAKACPDELLKLADGTWGRDLIKATALEALGRGDEARVIRLASESIPEGERREAAAQILASGDEKQVEKAADTLLTGKQDAAATQFLQDALDAYPGLVATLGMRMIECESCPDRKRVGDAILKTGDEALVRKAAESMLSGKQDAAARQFVKDALRAHPGLVTSIGARVLANGSYPDRREIAAALLATGDEALIGDAVETLLSSRLDSVSRQFIKDALDAYPGLMKALGAKLLASEDYPDRKEIGAAILETGDEALVRQTVQELLAGSQDSVRKEFVLDAAAAYPGIVKELWPKVRQWGRVHTSDHADYTTQGPHVDSTHYYDFYRYPDGRLVPKRDGRKSHTDCPMPSSDCTEYGHTDKNSHTDNVDSLKDYLARFPKAVRGND